MKMLIRSKWHICPATMKIFKFLFMFLGSCVISVVRYIFLIAM